jgi:uncharacterized protein (TIGR02996 family)
MSTQQALLAAMHADPLDPTPRLALADWLEEHDRLREAELTRWQHRLDSADLDDPRRRDFEARVQELLAAGVRPLVPLLTLQIAATEHLHAALIPPGSFYLGSKEGEQQQPRDERPRRQVTLTRPFYLGIYPVTQAQWWAVQHRQPSHFQGMSRPVDQVSWADCQSFCQRLSRKTGRRVRLPSEAEWEFACRAGTQTAFSGGEGLESMERCGWCGGSQTQPVGEKQPNGWGLFDMHGNVWEWCQDAYAGFPDADRIDPLHDIDSNTRVARGGSYSNPPAVCRSARRIGFAAGGRNAFIGCRVAIDWQT